jgi:hypothetical protein
MNKRIKIKDVLKDADVNTIMGMILLEMVYNANEGLNECVVFIPDNVCRPVIKELTTLKIKGEKTTSINGRTCLLLTWERPNEQSKKDCNPK